MCDPMDLCCAEICYRLIFVCVCVCVPSVIKQTKGKHAYRCSLFIWFRESNILKDHDFCFYL